MDVTLEALAKRVQTLEDLEAIRSLKARYLRALDERQPDVVLDCFHPEGAQVLYEGFPPFHTREAFVEVFRQMGCRPGVFDMHHAMNPEIELTGPDAAQGKWSLFFSTIDAGARNNLQMGVEYLDEYVRHGGRWWIKKTATRRKSFFLEHVAEDGTPSVLALGESQESFGEAMKAS